MMYRIGIDLGGTNIAVGLVDENYKIVVKKTTPTLAKRESEAIVADMARLCREVCAEKNVDIKDIVNIGVAAPGIANHRNGCVEYSCNLPFRRFPLVKALADELGVEESRVKIANDANAAAWGEAVAGAAKGTSNSIMVTLGTGVGGGIIIDNKIFSGFNAAAGEIGHIVIEQDGALCGCGRRGCWEAYSSATALVRMTKEAVEECERTGRYTSMSKAERISGRTACDAMRAGDEVATEVYNRYVKYLANGITNMVNIFQPEVISLGGGVSNEGQSLIDAILPIVRAEQYGGDVVELTQLRIAELGNDAGIIGAAALEQ
ncbi:MAG: ROK family protein [Clostridia bacterium]|nr:ROK family protein [Clostridia bacterium]